MGPAEQACLLSQGFLSTTYLLGIVPGTGLQRWKDARECFLTKWGKGARRQTIITEQMVALLEGRTKEMRKGSTWENVKSKRPCGGVWQGTSCGRDDANTTQPWMTRDGWSAVKCVLDHFRGREKKKEKEIYKLCMLSIVFLWTWRSFSNHRSVNPVWWPHAHAWIHVHCLWFPFAKWQVTSPGFLSFFIPF